MEWGGDIFQRVDKLRHPRPPNSPRETWTGLRLVLRSGAGEEIFFNTQINCATLTTKVAPLGVRTRANGVPPRPADQLICRRYIDACVKHKLPVCRSFEEFINNKGVGAVMNLHCHLVSTPPSPSSCCIKASSLII